MENTILIQAYSFFIYVISGIIISIFFDIFRILRKSFHTPDMITYIEDILFWIITGLFLIFILFTFSNGEIRIYNIIGIVLGALIYLLTISKYFIKINVSVIIFIKKIIYKTISIILFPIKYILKIIKKLFKPFTFFVINIKKVLYKDIKVLKKTKIKQKNWLGKKDFENICRKL